MKICNCSLAGTDACKTCSNYPYSYHIVNNLIDSRKTIPEHSAWFRISETLVDESKGHITPEQAIRKIKEYLRMIEKPSVQLEGETNAEKFKKVFGLYATELWAMPEEEFLSWLNMETR